MISLFLLIKNFLKEDFEWKSYLFLTFFLAVSIYYNYKYDFEDSILDSYASSKLYTLYVALFYGFAFVTVMIFTFVFKKQANKLREMNTWLKVLLVIISIAFLTSYKIPFIFDNTVTDPHEVYLVNKIIRMSSTLLLGLLTIPMLMYVLKSGSAPYFGITFKKPELKPYVIMLLIMMPLLIWASYQEGFQKQYPNMKFWMLNSPFGLSTFQIGIIYEFFYGMSFIATEVLFRGLLIIGLSKVLGKDVLLPAVAVYAFIHFGKPMPETIGSIFGGYILGVIALKKKHILGGIMIHMGVAISMDILAIAQHYKVMP
ncbi:CPBP family intramembrane metalloprotease [Cyclobacteriaceae bacterium]|nr:CPBP family intramembrane metalloprotease [Cyclobacteriaceae bacterium]